MLRICLGKEEPFRRCSRCDRPMLDGFVIDEGYQYFCSRECLEVAYTWPEYLEMYDEDAAYWTDWTSDYEPNELDEYDKELAAWKVDD